MESFSIQNIKSFVNSGEIELKPITILVGKNSCGKSSLLRFPAVLAQTANEVENDPPISLFGENIDYGYFEDVVHKNGERDISFSLTYKIDISGNSRIISNGIGHMIVRKVGNRDTDVRNTTISVSLGRPQNASRTSIKVHKVSILIDGIPISSLEWINSKKHYRLTLSAQYDAENKIIKSSRSSTKIIFNEDNVSFVKFFPVYYDDLKPICDSAGLSLSEDRFSLIRRKSLFWEIGFDLEEDADVMSKLSEDEIAILKRYRQFSFASSVMKGVYDAYINESKNRISYIGPFRQSPGRIYRYSEIYRSHVGPRGENVGDILINAYQRSKKSTLYADVSRWLEQYFGYKLAIKELGGNYYQLMLKDQNGIESNIIDVGFGISQVIPIISEMCLISRRIPKEKRHFSINHVVLVEQPELHLHPAAQASLAELFATCVTKNETARLIIETHSEHLIRNLEVLIADKSNPLTYDQVQVLYVDKDENGEAFCKEMKILPNGKFEEAWPSGFFDQGFKLSMALMGANA